MTEFRISRPIRISGTATSAIGGSFTAGSSVPVANAFTLTGPTSGVTSTASTFTVTPNGQLAATVVVTPLATNAGSVVPLTLTFSAGSTAAQTFTVVRTTDGTSVVSITNNGGLSNAGTPISYTTTAASSGTLSTFFTLTSASTNVAAPFTIGHAFVSGQVPAGTGVAVNTATAQVTPITYWPDGSLKHAIIAGTASLTANVAASINIASGTASSGTALTTTDLKNTSIVAAIGCGAFGTATWATTDLDTPHYQHVAGHRMSSWQYRKPVGSDSHLVAWLEVRLYAGGAVEVLPWIENAYLNVASPVTKASTTYTFTLGGTQRYSQTFVLSHHSRVPLVTGTGVFSHWLGTDPAVTPKHNVAYLTSTKLVPNYGYTSPSSATLNGLLQNYTPNTLAGVASVMGTAGSSAAIISNSQAFYLTTSGDPRGYRAALVFGLSGGSWQTHYRDQVTNHLIRFADYPNASTQAGQGTPELAAGIGATNGTPGISHQPSFGYLPYLISGWHWFWEEHGFWETWNYLFHTPGQRSQGTGTGAKAIHDTRNGTNANRGAHWGLRTLTQTLTLCPTSHPIYPDLVFSWENNTAHYAATYTVPGQPWYSPQGILGEYGADSVYTYYFDRVGTGAQTSFPTTTFCTWAATAVVEVNGVLKTNGVDYSASGTNIVFTVAPANGAGIRIHAPTTHWLGAGWMNMFGCQAWGFASDIGLPQSATSLANQLAVRNHAYKQVVGRANDGLGGNYNWRRFAVYAYPIGQDKFGLPCETWDTAAQSFTEMVFGAATDPALPVTPGLTLKAHSSDLDLVDGTSTAGDYGPFALSALAYAVDHSATDAAAGWTRVTGASNYVSAFVGLHQNPEHGIVPRSVGLPSWYPASAGQVVQIPGTNTIGDTVRASGGASYPGSGPTNIVAPWSGGALVTIAQQAYLLAYGGGHGDSSYNGIHKFGPLNGSGSDTPTWSVFLAPSLVSAIQVGVFSHTYLDGRQPSNHTYNGLIGVGDTLYSNSLGMYPANDDTGFFASTTAGQVERAGNPAVGNFGAGAHYNGKIYYFASSAQFDRLRIYDIALNTWSTESSIEMAFGNYMRMAIDTTRGAILINAQAIIADGGGAYWPSAATLAGRRTGITEAPSNTASMEYDADRDVFVSYVSGSLTLYECSAATLAAGGDAVWVARTFTGTVLQAAVPQGTFGRFRYVPQLKGYIVTPNIESPTYFFRST